MFADMSVIFSPDMREQTITPHTVSIPSSTTKDTLDIT